MAKRNFIKTVRKKQKKVAVSDFLTDEQDGLTAEVKHKIDDEMVDSYVRKKSDSVKSK